MITSQMFTVKGSSTWYSVWLEDDYRVVGKNPPADFNGEGLSPSQYTIVS